MLVYDPSRREMFTACSGEGAYLNGIAIHSGTKTALSGAVVGTALPIAASSAGADGTVAGSAGLHAALVGLVK